MVIVTNGTVIVTLTIVISIFSIFPFSYFHYPLVKYIYFVFPLMESFIFGCLLREFNWMYLKKFCG